MINWNSHPASNSRQCTSREEVGGKLDLTVIIVSYNTRKMTVECVRSVLEQTSSLRYEVIVVDNASTDQSVEAIRANFPEIHLIALDQNLGFGRANNLAADHAQGQKLLLLNPDTVVLNRAIEKVYGFALANPECRIWGGRTVFEDGTLNPQSCWKRMSLWSIFCNLLGLTRIKSSSLFNSEGYGGWRRDSVRTVDIVTGCFFLVDRNLWAQLKGFDSRYFMYGEEADLCLRARRFGARPIITPSATIIHYGGASEPNKADQLIKLFAGKVTLLLEHEPYLTRSVGRLFFLLHPLSRIIAFRAAVVVFGKRCRQSADVWNQVWANRQRWINGYSAGAFELPP